MRNIQTKSVDLVQGRHNHHLILAVIYCCNIARVTQAVHFYYKKILTVPNGNQKQSSEEGQTIQWSDDNGEKTSIGRQNTTQKT